LGETPRQKTASVVHFTVGSVPYLVSYISGFSITLLSYATSWIAGDDGQEVVAWFSTDFGPDYASMNTPWCWFYAGREPENRKLAADMPAGTHIREFEISEMDTEWPPTFAFCRTGVGPLKNRVGKESFPLKRSYEH